MFNDKNKENYNMCCICVFFFCISSLGNTLLSIKRVTDAIITTIIILFRYNEIALASIALYSFASQASSPAIQQIYAFLQIGFIERYKR